MNADNNISIIKAYPRFKWWLASRFFTNFGKQMLALIVSWQVYEISKNPIALGGIGLSEAIPFFMVAFWAGHLADTHERRGMLIMSQWGQFVSALVLFIMTAFGHPSLTVIYAMVGLAGLFTSFEVAAAGSYIQTMIPRDMFPKAAAWNLTLFNSATIIGPVLAGWIISAFSSQWAYFVTTFFFLLSGALTYKLEKIHPTVHHTEAADTWLARIKTGLRFIISERTILASISLDLFAVLFGGAIAIFPIFAVILGVGPTGLGMLRASQAVGSFFVAASQTRTSLFKSDWETLCKAVVLFGVCMIAFALSKNFILSLFVLTLSGVADGVSVIVRSSILQARTPDHLRGRVVSVGSIFIRSSNEIGAFESGVAAKLMGTVPSVVFGGIMTLVSVVAMRGVFSDINKSAENS